MQKENLQAGWTFMEVLIVMAIIAVLSATVGFQVIKSLEKARTTAAQAQIDSFVLALDAYYIDTGEYPDESDGLNALFSVPSGEGTSKKWNGPYVMKEIPKDPWGNGYIYKMPGDDGRAYEIVSYGADGTAGGEGKNQDITSWGNL